MITDSSKGKIRGIPVILVIAMILHAMNTMAQSGIANTGIELVGNNIHLTYDIENSNRSDRFHVRLEVTDSTGNAVRVKSLEGDVGMGVSGGSNKKIIWNLEADGIRMNADIYFELYADAIPEPEPEPPKTEEVAVKKTDTRTREEPGTESEGSKEEGVSRELSRTGIILQSLALPGLGLSRMKGGPHWLRGVAGYGSVAGALIMNKKAIATYEEYRTPESADDARSLLNKTTRQDNISEICAYAAIGIWVSDLAWTIIGSSDLNKNQAASSSGPVSIGTGYDALSGVPLLSFRLKF